jgi:hypothetical protein
MAPYRDHVKRALWHSRECGEAIRGLALRLVLILKTNRSRRAAWCRRRPKATSLARITFRRQRLLIRILKIHNQKPANGSCVWFAPSRRIGDDDATEICRPAPI